MILSSAQITYRQVFGVFSSFLSSFFSYLICFQWEKNHNHLRGSLSYGLFWHLTSVCLGNENALVQLKILSS